MLIAESMSSTSIRAQSGSPVGKRLTIGEKHRVAAPKESQLILLLDFYPNRKEIDAAGAGGRDLILASARFYAAEYLANPDYGAMLSVLAMIVYVDSMDEYNRANYSGMKQFGSLTFKREGAHVTLADDKLLFAPKN